MAGQNSKFKVLVVDDDEANRIAFSAVLASLPVDLKLVEGGAEAIEACVRETFGLIIMDVMMPRISGIQAAERIRADESESQTPILFLTAANPNDKLIEEGTSLGLADFLFKPVSATLLRARVAAYLELQEMHRRVREAESEKTSLEFSRARQHWEMEQLQRQVEQERRNSELSGQFRSMVENLKDVAVFLISLKGEVLTWNEAAARVYGYANEEIVGTSFGCLFAPEDRQNDLPAKELEKAVLHGRADLEQWYLRKDGTRFWGSGVITQVRDGDGQVIALAKLMQDNTERTNWETRLKERARELERLNRELERFTYIATHDLKEPIRAIGNYVQLLHKEYQPAEGTKAHKYFNFVLQGVKHSYRLIDDLLQYININNRTEPFGEVDCNEILSRVKEEFSLEIRETRAEVYADRLPAIDGMRNGLLMLFRQLLSNSLKFRSTSSPVIRIRAEHFGNFWAFSFSDNGIGVNPEYSSKIFELFQRLHTRTAYAGSGLGLAQCKRIVERHGGRIWLESKEKEGTTFYFTLRRERRTA